MPLGVRIFLVYFLFVGLAGWFVLSTVMDEIRPVYARAPRRRWSTPPTCWPRSCVTRSRPAPSARAA